MLSRLWALATSGEVRPDEAQRLGIAERLLPRCSKCACAIDNANDLNSLSTRIRDEGQGTRGKGPTIA
jgi:hypothetical protein